jgi:uncharacterized membrane protein YkvA (DUF1232 family)
MKVKNPDNIEKYSKNYSEEDFWAKVKKVARKAGAKVIYVALILYYELADEKVSLKEKGIILGALGYFILPVDVIPDFIPAAGYTDDLAALVAAFAYVKSHLTPEVRMRAQFKLREWFGDLDASSIEPEEQ